MTKKAITTCEMYALFICAAIIGAASACQYFGQSNYAHALTVHSIAAVILLLLFWVPLVIAKNLLRLNAFIVFLLIPAITYFLLYFGIAVLSPAEELTIHGVEIITDGKVTSAGYREIVIGSASYACLGILFGCLLYFSSRLCKKK